MKNELRFGQPVDKWAQYGLYEYPLVFNNRETKHKAIVKNNSIVTIVKTRYKLIPNEKVIEVADEAAKLAGLVPFDKFSGKWIMKFGKDESHVIKDNWKIHALYASEEPYIVKTKYGDEDEMYMGVAVHNSIDRTMGFTGGIFTFRAACRNVVLSAGMKNWSYDYNRNDHGKTIESFYKRHTKSMEVLAENLLPTLTNLMERSLIIKDTYNEMAKRKINLQIMQEIRATKMPKKLYPEYIPPPKVPIETVPDVTQWQMYNDFTEKIWHNDKAEMTSKLLQFKYLHQVLPFEVAPVA
jgi:hypothetical protein